VPSQGGAARRRVILPSIRPRPTAMGVASARRTWSRNTALLRSFQISLVVLAMVGTLVLIYLFFVMVIRPVTKLQDGIQRMAAADFSVRLPVQSQDEFGALADGFNQMADRLQNLYGTLEDRVQEKTRSLEDKTRNWRYCTNSRAFLNKTASVEDLCRGVLKKPITSSLRRRAGASGGAEFECPAYHHPRRRIGRNSPRRACLTLAECLSGRRPGRQADILGPQY
jgi:two-component system nitrate/nitrite sensor histidine kinase NarX